jgi:hypothetical protein
MVSQATVAALIALLSPTAAPTAPIAGYACGDTAAPLYISGSMLNVTEGGSDDPAVWTESFKQFRSFARSYQRCPRDPQHDLVGAYLALWEAVLEQHAGNTIAARNTLNTSTQLFEKCISRYYATRQGGECESMVRENVKRQIAWDGE